MEEDINKINKKIQLLEEYKKYIEEKKEEAYKIDSLDYNYLIPANYDIDEKIEDLKYLKDILEKLKEEKIDISKEYIINDYIHLKIDLWNNHTTFYFGINNCGWIYDNYICSYSGITEWINKLVEEEYDLFSGNSSYNYALGTCNLNRYKMIIENKKDKYNKRNYSPDKVISSIKNLINFFTDDKNKIRNIIVDEINYKFNNMKKLLEEEE